MFIQNKPCIYSSTSVCDGATRSPKKVSTCIGRPTKGAGIIPKGSRGSRPTSPAGVVTDYGSAALMAEGFGDTCCRFSRTLSRDDACPLSSGGITMQYRYELYWRDERRAGRTTWPGCFAAGSILLPSPRCETRSLARSWRRPAGIFTLSREARKYIRYCRICEPHRRVHCGKRL